MRPETTRCIIDQRSALNVHLQLSSGQRPAVMAFHVTWPPPTTFFRRWPHLSFSLGNSPSLALLPSISIVLYCTCTHVVSHKYPILGSIWYFPDVLVCSTRSARRTINLHTNQLAELIRSIQRGGHKSPSAHTKTHGLSVACYAVALAPHLSPLYLSFFPTDIRWTRLV